MSDRTATAEMRRARFYAEESEDLRRSRGRFRPEEPNVRVWARALTAVLESACRGLSPEDFTRLGVWLVEEFRTRGANLGPTTPEDGPAKFHCAVCGKDRPEALPCDEHPMMPVHRGSGPKRQLHGVARIEHEALHGKPDFAQEPSPEEVTVVAADLKRSDPVPDESHLPGCRKGQYSVVAGCALGCTCKTYKGPEITNHSAGA